MNPIMLDGMERAYIAGLQARQRELKMVSDKLSADSDLLLAALQEKYGVIMDSTHLLNWQTGELIPFQPPPGLQADDSTAHPS